MLYSIHNNNVCSFSESSTPTVASIHIHFRQDCLADAVPFKYQTSPVNLAPDQIRMAVPIDILYCRDLPRRICNSRQTALTGYVALFENTRRRSHRSPCCATPGPGACPD